MKIRMLDWQYTKNGSTSSHILKETEDSYYVSEYVSYDCDGQTGNCLWVRKDSGLIIRVREVDGYADNLHDTEYTPRPISKERMDWKRDHAVANPTGHTAELVGYIDWLMCRLEKVYDAIDDLPISLSDFVDFSECPDDDDD